MKRLLTFLNLLLCFELILSPVQGHGGSFFVSDALAADCPAGTQFDTTLNRCLTTEQTANIMNATAHCNGDKACYKKNAEDALKKAEDDGKVPKEIAKSSGMINTSMKVAAIAVPLYTAFIALKDVQKNSHGVSCGAMSYYIMLGAGAVGFAGDFFSNMQHKARLKKLKEEWDKIASTDGSPNSNANSASSSATTSSTTSTTTTTKAKATESQSQAFEMLAKSEDSLAAAAKMKGIAYGIATAGFGAVAVMAAMELIKRTPPCKATSSPSTPSSPATPVTPPAATGMLENSSFDRDYKYKSKYVRQIAKTESFASLFAMNESLQESFESHSCAGVQRFESYNDLFKHTQFEKTDELFSSTKDAVIVDAQTKFPILESILNNLSLFSDAHAQAASGIGTLTHEATTAQAGSRLGGSAINKFLVSAEGRLVISGVLAAWSATMTMHALKQASVSKKRAEYLRSVKDSFNDASTAIGSCSDAERASPQKPNCYCYTANGQHNPDRSSSQICMNLFTGKSASAIAGNYLTGSSTSGNCISNSGSPDATCTCQTNNTCLKVSSNLSGLHPGTFSMLSGPLSNMDKLSSGGNVGSIDAAGQVSNAARLIDAANKVLATDKNGQDLLNNKSNLANNASGALIASGNASGISPSSLLGGGSSNPFNFSNPTQAAAALDKELGKSGGATVNTASGGGTLAAPASGGTQQLDFGLTPDQAAAQNAQVAEVMGQNLDYGQNDVNSNNGANIFEVLSNRYQRSGMRRLFDTEGKTQADKPAQSDIAQ